MIYIATHKKFNVPNLNGYCALQVGAEGKEKYGYLRDNIGNHISGKNANYCELTGLYWIWKNTDDSYKGLVHYRRYFGRNNLSNKISDICSYEYLLNCLKSVDIVLPYVEYFKQNAPGFRRYHLSGRCLSERYQNSLDRLWIRGT